MVNQISQRQYSQRQLRVGELVKQNLGELFIRNEAKLPNINSKHHKNLIRRNTMDNFLSIFSRLWSDEKAQNRIGEDQIRIWAKTEYGRDWVHAYNYYLTNGQMPKENSRGLNNVQ